MSVLESATAYLSKFPASSDHDVTLFFHPSPGISWDSPGKLTRGTLRNKLLGLPRGIGHVSLMVRTTKRILLTGMTQESKSEGRREVLFKGYGLGILFHRFAGHVETPEELAPELEARSHKGNLSYYRVDLGAENAARLLEYYDEYRKRGGGTYYGGMKDPRDLDAVGCSAFAASFLDVAGCMNDELKKAWTRDFLIPRAHIGGPMTGRYVSPLQMMLVSRWAHENEEHEKGMFWDPDLMHAWTVKQSNPELWNNARGIRVDARDRSPGTDPFFRSSEK